MDREPFKKLAGERAVNDHVRSGMKLGLGTGSTAVWALRHIAEKLASGELTNIVGVPTSSRTRAEAEKLGVPLTTLADHPQLDVTIDGADEIDPNLNLIKGGGVPFSERKSSPKPARS